MSDTWYFVNMARDIGIEDTLNMVMGDGFNSEETTEPEVMIENVRREQLEGMSQAAQNKRELCHEYVRVFEWVTRECPTSVRKDFAESELCVFSGGFMDDRTDEEKEYIEYLEEIVE